MKLSNKRLLTGLALSWVVLAAPVCAATLKVDNDHAQCPDAPYTTIQAAVAAAQPGDTIRVCPGVYSGAPQILITKPLQLLGAGADSTIIDGANAPLNSSAGMVRFDLAGGNGVLSGFTLRDASVYGPDSPYGKIDLWVQSSSPNSRFLITRNRLQGGAAEAPGTGSFGFYTASQGAVEFSDNQVSGTYYFCVLLERHPGPSFVHHNTLSALAFPAYRNETWGGTDVPSLQQVDTNIVAAPNGVGIEFVGEYVSGQGSGRFRNVLIRNNAIFGVGSKGSGIGLANGASGNGALGVITGAKVLGNTIKGNGNANSRGIRTFGRIVDPVIQYNTVTGVDRSFWGQQGFGGTTVATGVALNFNDIEKNGTGLVWEGTETLDAQCNYWGSPNGPTAPGHAGGGDRIVGPGPVDYTPWLRAYTPKEIKQCQKHGEKDHKEHGDNDEDDDDADDHGHHDRDHDKDWIHTHRHDQEPGED